MKEKEYVIVQGHAPQGVSGEISRRLSEGWELVGGLQVAAYPDPSNATAGRIVYAQAMTREAPEEEAKKGMAFS
jgi:hypothetical protein